MDKLPGIFRNIFPDVSLGNYGIRVVEITRPIWREGRKTYIELSETLSPGDVFELSGTSHSYRVLTDYEMRGDRGYTHKIARTDCNSIAGLDIRNSERAGKVKVINRKTYKEDKERAMKVYPPY